MIYSFYDYNILFMKKSLYSFSILVAVLFLSGCQSQEYSQESNEQTQPGEKFVQSPEKSSVPPCPNPLVMTPPVDISLVSGILYPGQYRGGNYKPHGGFRFDGKKTGDITVTAPFDGRLTSGSRYIEQGEVQHLLFFENPCGITYRFDHLLTLSPAMQNMVDTLPPALPDDSRTTRFDTPLEVKTGDVIATAVGFAKNQNVSVDWGVYDLRQTNTASKNEDYARKHEVEKEQAFYALCWFDLLPQDIAQKVRSLPASSSEAKTSDYCQ